MNNYFTTFKINDHIYQIKDAMGALTTLIIGKDKALLIDTGYGLYNLKEYISHITSLPLIVVASHGHMDHTGGNYLFDQVYIDEKDMNLCMKHNSKLWRQNEINTAINLNLIDDTFKQENFLKQREGNLIPLKPNQEFDLGHILVLTIPMEGHTKGSTGFYLKEDKILVVADATCPFVWLFLDESTTVSTYITMLERILKLDFNYILLGHGQGKLLPKSKVYDFLEVARHIDLKSSVKVSFKNFEDSNSYCYTNGIMYNQDDTGIVFDPNKL